MLVWSLAVAAKDRCGITKISKSLKFNLPNIKQFLAIAFFFGGFAQWVYSDVVRSADGLAVITKVRFFPAPDAEKAMLGGKICGSNVSYRSGYDVLAEIKTVPPLGQWTELEFPNKKPYRWIRYEGPAGSHGKVAEIEFYSGDKNLTGNNGGNAFGTVPCNDKRIFFNALDKKTDTWFEAEKPDGAFVGTDLQGGPKPRFDPEPGVFDGPVDVAIKAEKGAKICYTLDGTWPDATHGLVYTQPIKVTRNTSIMAVATMPDRAPTRFEWGNYFLKASLRSEQGTFHIGNSLTHVLDKFSFFAGSAGHKNLFNLWVRPGAPTIEMWNVGPAKENLSRYRNTEVDGKHWDDIWGKATAIKHFTMQPRDWNTDEEADYEARFCKLFHERFPEAQPWIYSECGGRMVEWLTSKGVVPSSQMKTLPPALTWEESCASYFVYAEDVQTKVLALNKAGKRIKVLPSVLMIAWAKNLTDQGKIPGLAPGSFFGDCFADGGHASMPNVSQMGNGAWLVSLIWYGAFYGESPEGRVLPMSTTYTPEQARIFQRLAWDILKNYPDFGIYEDGKTPVEKAVFSPAPSALSANRVVTLSSKTPGAWFRYSLDGTEPTRTRGYIYCGVITARPGMAIKAIAYKSGMADSPVSTAIY